MTRLMTNRVPRVLAVAALIAGSLSGTPAVAGGCPATVRAVSTMSISQPASPTIVRSPGCEEL